MSHAVRIVLVEPSHPGNIGSVARAMKNMGLAELWLVSPRQFPHAEATALASGAADLLAVARVVDSVPAALAGCGFVLGTTARVRTQYPWPILAARDAAVRAVGEAMQAPVALLFGPERTGLTNDHLALCHALVQIPTNPDYSSLNLAQAVLLLAYELRMAGGATVAIPEREIPLPAVETLDHLYAHFDRVMQRAGFETHGNAAHVSRRVRRLLHRAVPDQQEVNLLRGFLSAVETVLPEADHPPGATRALRPYFDHAASTPLRPAARLAWLTAGEGAPDAAGGWVPGNPTASAHLPGRHAAAVLAGARERLAACLGALPESLVFTSGATEADNLAILGAVRGEAQARGRSSGGSRGHVLTAKTEHRAVLAACEQLAREGFVVEYLVPGPDGQVTADTVAAALRPDTLLVSLMLVNNETGVLQDLRGITAVCRSRGVLVHTDAAQALGRISIDVDDLDIDLLSVSAHKCGGPTGIGALYVRRLPRPTVEPLLFGGGQEGALRPGTPSVALAAAFAAAAAEATAAQSAATDAQHQWAERLLLGLRGLPGWHQNGRDAPRVPAILSLTFDGVDGEALLLAMEPFAVASGSACSSATREPSGVLRALGLDDERAEATLRISFGWTTSTAAVEALTRHLARTVSRLRALVTASREGTREGRVALADPLPTAADPPGPYSRRLRQWVAAPLRAWVDSPLEGTAADWVEGTATDRSSRTVVTFRAGPDGHGGLRVRWLARGCPHVLGACEVMAETLERELVFRRRVSMNGTGGESGPSVTVPPMDLRTFAAAVDAPPDKLTRLLAVQEAAAALRKRYTAD
ncbi:MAG: TrmJ/YjtD family RNA methyltransferase [Gammaproteobacteria bacterium]